MPLDFILLARVRCVLRNSYWKQCRCFVCKGMHVTDVTDSHLGPSNFTFLCTLEVKHLKITSPTQTAISTHPNLPTSGFSYGPSYPSDRPHRLTPLRSHGHRRGAGPRAAAAGWAAGARHEGHGGGHGDKREVERGAAMRGNAFE